MSARRIWAVVLRQVLVYRRSGARLAEMFYWPTVNVLVWAFLSLYLRQIEDPSLGLRAASAVVGALLLWDMLFRSQQAFSMTFLEDVWSRNLLNVFASPIRPAEYIAGGVIAGMIKVSIAMTVAALLAWWITGFGLLSLGLPLAAFVFNLVLMGFAIGVVTMAMILYYGEGAETLAWALSFLFQPISAVFYPVSVLPRGLRAVAAVIPASHVFEGMRSVLARQGFAVRELVWASGLNVLWVAASLAFFSWMFARVRRTGALSRFGE